MREGRNKRQDVEDDADPEPFFGEGDEENLQADWGYERAELGWSTEADSGYESSEWTSAHDDQRTYNQRQSQRDGQWIQLHYSGIACSCPRLPIVSQLETMSTAPTKGMPEKVMLTTAQRIGKRVRCIRKVTSIQLDTSMIPGNKMIRTIP